MPLVKIFLRSGKNEEYRRSISDAIHSALVKEANVPEDDRFHVIHELPHEDLVAHPSYGGVDRSNNLVIIEITLNAGRSVEIKRGLYRAIARILQESADVRPDDVLISLVEVQRENWSFGRGIATYAQE